LSRSVAISERDRVSTASDLTGRCCENRQVVVAERLAPQAADDDRADAAPARAHRHEARRLDPELGENRPVTGPECRDDVAAHAKRRSRPERRARWISVVVQREELAFPNHLFLLECDSGDPEAVPLGVVDHEGREVVRHDAPQTRRDVVEDAGGRGSRRALLISSIPSRSRSCRRRRGFLRAVMERVVDEQTRR
jgi:hypothetical protein